MEKLLDFDEVAVISAEYLDHQDDREAKEKFDEMKSKISVRSYLTLDQKEMLLELVLYDIKVLDDEPESFVIGLELSKFFNGLLGYTNIECDPESLSRTAPFYEIFQNSGLYDYILGFCEKDYCRLEKQIDEMLRFDNIKFLCSLIEKMTPDSVDELSKEFKRFTNDIDATVIKNLADIARNQDPLLHSIKETMENGAYESISKLSNKTEQKEKE